MPMDQPDFIPAMRSSAVCGVFWERWGERSEVKGDVARFGSIGVVGSIGERRKKRDAPCIAGPR